MEIRKEDVLRLGLIISHFKNAGRASNDRISILLEETFSPEFADILSFFLKIPEITDSKVAYEKSFGDDGIDPFFAAINIIYLDMLGDNKLFPGIAKIFAEIIKEKKIVDLLKELYSLQYISALSLNTRSSIISWLFSDKNYLSEDVLNICASSFFFPSDITSMVRHLINFKMYDETLIFLINRDSDEIRTILALNLPTDYLVHLLDSSPYIREIIDERFGKELLD